MPCFAPDAAGVEEIQRQSGSSASGPPNLGGLLSALLGGEAGGPAPGGNPQRTMHGPSSAGGGGAGGGLMDILQSPAMQQMANQLLGPPPGSPRVTLRSMPWNTRMYGCGQACWGILHSIRTAFQCAELYCLREMY